MLPFIFTAYDLSPHFTFLNDRMLSFSIRLIMKAARCYRIC